MHEKIRELPKTQNYGFTLTIEANNRFYSKLTRIGEFINNELRKAISMKIIQAFGIEVPKVNEKKNWKDICREHLNYNPDIFLQCGKGRRLTIETFIAERSPPLVFSALSLKQS